MIVKKKAKPRKSSKTRTPHAKDWRDAIRRHLSKVPGVDAVYVNTASSSIHVYSVVEDFHTTDCKRLMRQEDRIEREFPEVSFEFHTRAHRGKKPTGRETRTSELAYLRQ